MYKCDRMGGGVCECEGMWECKSGIVRVIVWEGECEYGGGDSDENVFVSAGGSVTVLECLRRLWECEII